MKQRRIEYQVLSWGDRRRRHYRTKRRAFNVARTLSGRVTITRRSGLPWRPQQRYWFALGGRILSDRTPDWWQVLDAPARRV